MSSASSSESENESEEEVDNRKQTRVGNAFAGFNLDSSDSDNDDDSSSSSSSSSEDGKRVSNKETIGVMKVDERSDGNSDSEDDSLEDGQDDAHDDDEMSEFDNLVERSTRNGAIIQSDFVDAIKQLIGGGGGSSTCSRPTEIQCECWTTMLSPLTSDRDVIAISKTGSGKTLSFLVPLLCSLTASARAESSSKPPRNNNNNESDPTTGTAAFIYPRAIILAPTRVLAQQIFEVASILVKNTPSLSDVQVSVSLGGSAYHQQMADLLLDDPDLIIATPGRLNSLCGHVTDDTQEAEMCIKLDEIRELVIDEADMMLALGFQNALSWFAQLVNASSVKGFRLVLTSATWDEKTSSNLSRFQSISKHEPVFLATEGAGQVVTKNVTQRVEVLAHKGAPRFKRLVALLTEALLKDNMTGSSRVVVFCLHKAQARQMGKDLRPKGIANVVLEGDMSQSARAAAIEAFRNGKQGLRVLVATDVAARGLDVLGISHVFNYSLGISIESYIHRSGRTGRAGRFGVAHTFVVKGLDEKLTPELCVVLKQANQFISDDLRIMAGKEMKKRTTRGSNDTANDDDTKADLEEIRELRQANRAKQLLQQHQRGAKQSNTKRRGRK
mmetsp:Transcript_13998/g.25314  ORF Transcript_13998/g.25314 Transcript_13998/m.25314 type:complete len:613 (-) Transcript_13998:106-1944(-)